MRGQWCDVSFYPTQKGDKLLSETYTHIGKKVLIKAKAKILRLAKTGFLISKCNYYYCLQNKTCLEREKKKVFKKKMWMKDSESA